MIAIEDSPTQRFLKRLGPAIDAHWGRPKAVVVMSAHTMGRTPLVLAAPQHGTVHDFGGFPPALYQIHYNAPGDPALAQQISQWLGDAGHPVAATPHGGLDHGIWTALMHMWPDASVPVVPVMLPTLASPHTLLGMGQALQSLCAEGVLVMGSGSLTHNLHRVFGPGGMPSVQAPEEADCADFRQWVLERTQASDWPALVNWQSQAPHALAMHPTDEHWRPFYFAAGAAGASPQGGADNTPGLRLHADVEFGCLAMDAYAFGPSAGVLQHALN